MIIGSQPATRRDQPALGSSNHYRTYSFAIRASAGWTLYAQSSASRQRARMERFLLTMASATVIITCAAHHSACVGLSASLMHWLMVSSNITHRRVIFCLPLLTMAPATPRAGYRPSVVVASSTQQLPLTSSASFFGHS
jgi:hypothetical protein